MRGPLGLLLIACACSFEPDAVGGNDGDGGSGGDASASDAPPRAPRHVPSQGAFPGTGSFTLSGSVDTGALRIGGAPVSGGASFDVWPQEPSGPELAVLHVGALTVPSGVVLVSGSRPLVIIAGDAVTIDGVIDLAAQADAEGPGGAGPGMGGGAGQGGAHAGVYRDGGGGGAGFGEAGGQGGDAVCPSPVICEAALGGDAGPAYGTAALDVLVGGSGGGAAPSEGCGAGPAGAGGGALQITSRVAIAIGPGAGVHAGGGGGGGGLSDNVCDWGAGAGGGAGGAIALQAPLVTNAGILAANGGGGGGSAGGTNPNGDPGEPGQDGAYGIVPAPGGAPGGTLYGARGGNGSAVGAFAEPGGRNDDSDGNGGGGGGAGGRILFYVPEGATPTVGTCSPSSMVVSE